MFMHGGHYESFVELPANLQLLEVLLIKHSWQCLFVKLYICICFFTAIFDHEGLNIILLNLLISLLFPFFVFPNIFNSAHVNVLIPNFFCFTSFFDLSHRVNNLESFRVIFVLTVFLMNLSTYNFVESFCSARRFRIIRSNKFHSMKLYSLILWDFEIS